MSVAGQLDFGKSRLQNQPLGHSQLLHHAQRTCSVELHFCELACDKGENLLVDALKLLNSHKGYPAHSASLADDFQVLRMCRSKEVIAQLT